mmetsp:Transcript_12118/g.23038  ORF Transcript_12118/g.23038 Transcript_12118/m.23038 type:complete len:442 (+) Transcript_12118:55-1380(+)
MAGRPHIVEAEPNTDDQTQSSDQSVNVRLHFILGPTDLNGDGNPATYVHYLFGETDTHDGYTGLEIEVFMHAGNLKPFFSITYEERGPADLLNYIKAELRLPHCYNSPMELSEGLQKPYAPPGLKIHSYTKSSCVHTVYLACSDSPGFLELHPYLNALPIWFIDGASLIDITEPHWKYFLLYRDTDRGPALVGLCSVYYFWTSFNSCRVRLSQFLILPQYQRKGYGSDLLQAIYNHILGDDRVFQITVEDCSEEMQRLRDVVDVQGALQYISWANSRVTEDNYPMSTVEDTELLQKKLKITKNQASRCLELIKLGLLSPENEHKESPVYRKWRLEVKRRLFRDNYHQLKPESQEQKFKHIYIHDDSEAEEEAKIMLQLKSLSPSLFEQIGRYFGMKLVPQDSKPDAERKTMLRDMFALIEEEYESVLHKVRELIAARKSVS